MTTTLRIITLIATAFIFTMCAKEVVPEITGITEIPATSSALTSSGGNASISFNSNVQWTASSSAQWITVSPASGGAGSNVLTAKTDANTSTADRSGTVTISALGASKSISITQKGCDIAALTLSVTALEMTATAESKSIGVSCNYGWTVKSDQEWCTVSPESGSKDGSITVSAKGNDVTASRTATLTVTAGANDNTVTKTVTVVQKGIDEVSLTLSVASLEMAAVEESKSIGVSCNYDWSVKSDQEWCTVSPESGTKDGSITVTAKQNETAYSRTATLTVTAGSGDNTASKTVAIEQKGDETERDALIMLYNNLRGNEWKNHDGWCSDLPLSQWYGVRTDNDGRVTELLLHDNEISGSFPTEILKFERLIGLYLQSNKFSGEIPEEIGNLPEIQRLVLRDNEFTGKLPSSIGKLKHLEELVLSKNKLSGPIPPELYECTSLQEIWASGNDFSGTIPQGISALSNLRLLYLNDNELSGDIPEELGSMTSLTNVLLSDNDLTGTIPAGFGNLPDLIQLGLDNNKLTGEIPATMGSRQTLKFLYLYKNQLSGRIPESILMSQAWRASWYYILDGNDFDLDGVTISAPSFSVTDLNGNTLSSATLYSSNKFTILYHWASWCPFSKAYTPQLIEWYNTYHSLGVEVIGYAEEEASVIKNAAEELKMPWSNFANSPNTDLLELYFNSVPTVNVVDNAGKIVFNALYNNKNDLGDFLALQFGKKDTTFYASTDYSADGNVTTLQTHTSGSGIRIIFTGDAFVDRDIADGTFDKYARQAMEAFFAVEPYKSMRSRFDVYSVAAVSKNREISNATETAFNSKFQIGNAIAGNDTKVFSYASKVSGTEIPKSLVVVIVNSSRYAGACWLYKDGSAISYVPHAYNNDATFSELIQHEAGGHGFGKLLDEYVTQSSSIDETAKANFIYERDLGWGANVDIVSDAASIQWAKFISDSRYSTSVGIYEGALNYQRGAWRPTENSIMRYNTDGFNAPSRNAIYKRIMELSGEEYTWDKFVDYDAANRASAAATARRSPWSGTDNGHQPLPSPILVRHAWNR